VAKDVMSHRLVLGFDAVADNITPAQVVERIIAMVPPPTPVWNGSAAGQGQPTQGQPPQGAPQGQPGHPQGQPQPGHNLQPDYS
jgi:MoxR-like ATPase